MMSKGKHMTTRRAFTLVELLVAITITVLMLGLVGRIFLDTSAAVSSGISVGRNIEASRTVSDQVQRDAERMIPPNATVGTPAGFLVILNRRLPAQTFTMPGGSKYVESIRDDQLVFIAAPSNANDFHAVTPATEGGFSSGFSGAYARVWYGHALRTQSTGADPAGDLGTNENADPAKWILGRQALLLDITPAGPPGIYANGAAYNSPVVGFSTAPTPPTNPDVLFRGLTDLSNATIVNINALLLAAGPAYKATAYDFTYGPQRLLYNQPQSSGGYQSWQIAQSHSALMEGVSDFEVSFAADITHSGYTIDISNGKVIFGLDIDGGSNLVWYDMDTAAATFTGATPAFTPYDNSTAPVLASHAFVFRHDDDQAWVTGVATPAAYGSQWPYMIRIRYRIHDPRGASVHTDDTRLTDGIDNNGVDGVDDSAESRVPGQWFEQIIKVRRD